MYNLRALKGPRGTNFDRLFIKADSPTGRILSKTGPVMAFDSKRGFARDMQPNGGIPAGEVKAADDLSIPERIMQFLEQNFPLEDADLKSIQDFLMSPDGCDMGRDQEETEPNKMAGDRKPVLANDRSVSSFESRFPTSRRVRVDNLGIK